MPGLQTRLRAAVRVLVLCVCASVASVRLLVAQCPDGTPPPCRSAAARRVPALDERTWIVLPFANTTRAPDVDWLSAASANLLYLGLARWTDVRAVDDGRVVDLMRESALPRGEAIGLDAGLALARRAGAGRLVMGDYLKAGGTAQLVAKVYNVRSGQRLRNVSETAQLPDSVMPAFARLAAKVLDLPPAPGLEGGAGTANTDAYRAYLAGMPDSMAVYLPRMHAALDPESERGYGGLLALARGDYATAAALLSWRYYGGWLAGDLVRALVATGRTAAARATLDSMRAARTPGYYNPYGIAKAFAALGESDSAFVWLERARDERTSFLSYLPMDPAWAPLRGDPRFAAFLKRLRP